MNQIKKLTLNVTVDFFSQISNQCMKSIELKFDLKKFIGSNFD